MVYQDEKISNLLNCSKLQIALEMQLKIQGEKMELLNAFSYLGRPQCLVLVQFAIWSCISCIKLAPLFLYNWGLNLVYIYFICSTHCRYQSKKGTRRTVNCWCCQQPVVTTLQLHNSIQLELSTTFCKISQYRGNVSTMGGLV